MWSFSIHICENCKYTEDIKLMQFYYYKTIIYKIDWNDLISQSYNSIPLTAKDETIEFQKNRFKYTKQ